MAGQVTALAAGDMNADGFVDLVVAQTTSEVFVYTGDGKGGFVAGAAISLPGTATALHLVDLDGDAKLDVLAVIGGGGVQLIPGATMVAGPTAVPLASAIAVRDLGTDAAPDTFVALPGAELELYANDGSGVLALAAGTTAAPGTRSLTTLDSDMNGVAEAVLAVDASTQLAFYESAGASFNTASYQLPGGTQPQAIAAADMDGDGLRDLLVLDAAGPALRVEKSQGAGLGMFAPLSAVPVAALAGAESLRIVDVDSDGRPEVALLTADGNVSIAGLVAGSTLALSSPQTGTPGATCLTVADVNHDGRPDLVLGGASGLSVALNQLPSCSDGVLDGAETDVDCGGGCPRCTQGKVCKTSVDCVSGTCAGTCASMTLALADAVTAATLPAAAGAVIAARPDAASGLSLLVSLPTSGQLAYVQGDGAGAFSLPTLTPAGSSPSALSAVDLRSDGKLDLLVGDPGSSGLLVIGGTGSGSSWLPPTTLSIGPVTGLGAGDFDGDGLVDYVATNGVGMKFLVGLGLESGGFVSLSPKPVGNVPGAVKLGDLDGDGRLDVISASGGPELDVNHGRGPGAWKSLLGGPGGTFTGSPVVAFALADVNADKMLDMVVANSAGTVTLFLQTGPGSFSLPTIDTLSSSIVDVAFADVDGDGDLDLLVLEGAGVNLLRVYPNQGAGMFGMPISKPVSNGLALSVGRFDGDGKVDVVVVPSVAGPVVLLTNAGL
jgi:hypothetical protein